MPPQRTGRFVRSGFADEIADSLDEQLDVLDDLGISHLDLRAANGTDVLAFGPDQVENVRQSLDDAGVGVSSIGSPIGKIPVTHAFDPHLDRFRRALDLAEAFDAEYVRLFSYYVPEGDDPADHRDEVVRRMRRKAELAEQAGVVLVHENEKRIYGDTPGRCRDILESVDSPYLRAAFDPANFLEVGESPYPEGLLDLVEHVEQLHVKDAVFGQEGEITLPGEGDANLRAIVEALDRRGFDGYASMEPHLFRAGERSGFSGPEKFSEASRAFDGILDRVGARYV